MTFSRNARIRLPNVSTGSVNEALLSVRKEYEEMCSLFRHLFTSLFARNKFIGVRNITNDDDYLKILLMNTDCKFLHPCKRFKYGIRNVSYIASFIPRRRPGFSHFWREKPFGRRLFGLIKPAVSFSVIYSLRSTLDLLMYSVIYHLTIE